MEAIDFVVPMVFHDDPLWQQDFGKVNRRYDESNPYDFVRYRSWEIEDLLIRCVRKYMPFVRTIYIILALESQKKGWMDADGVTVVYHRDFIPERFLPTFGLTFEMFLHRIDGLSERFIYGNDDIFPLAPLTEKDFFDGDVPCIHNDEKPFPESPNIFHWFCQNGLNFVAKEFGKHYTTTFMKGGHGLTPMAYFEKLGVLENPVYAAHCVWVTEEDLDIAAKHHVTIVHNPTSNLKLGSGFAPIPQALAKDIRVALGTDGCASNNNLNMWEEMHLAAILHKGYTGDPTVVTPAQVLDMATLNGCLAMGRNNSGVLAEGKAADIICVDLNALHMQPALDIPALLTYSAQASDVKMTMVDGKILYENGVFFTMDVEKIKAGFQKSCERLLK